MSESGASNKNSKRNKRKSKQKPPSTCSENVEQYLLNSTLHGLRYVGDRKISYFERYKKPLICCYCLKTPSVFQKNILWIVFRFRYNFVSIFHFKHMEQMVSISNDYCVKFPIDFNR